MGGCTSSQKVDQMFRNGIIQRPCAVCYPTEKRVQSFPPLIIAASLGHYKCLDLLIQAGADVNVGDHKRNHTAVMHAVDKGRAKCLDLLIRAGADIHKRRDDGLTALHIASTRGHKECLKLLINAGVNVNKSDDKGCAALIAVAQTGNTKCLEILIEAGADVDCKRKKSGETALICASRWGHDRCVEMLLNAGANIEAASMYGNTALSDAAWGGHEKCMELLIKAGADVKNSTALSRAAMVGRVECLQMLIEAGANVNKSGTNGYPNLISAATRSACIDCVRILLKAGAHINQPYLPSQDFLQYLSQIDDKRKCAVLLYVAGEQMDNTTLEKNELLGDITPVEIAEHLEFTDLKLSLKHMCRQIIRKHLIFLNPHLHLFDRLHKLGLPPLLRDYLLYGFSLDDQDCEEIEKDETDNDTDDQEIQSNENDNSTANET